MFLFCSCGGRLSTFKVTTNGHNFSKQIDQCCPVSDWPFASLSPVPYIKKVVSWTFSTRPHGFLPIVLLCCWSLMNASVCMLLYIIYIHRWNLHSIHMYVLCAYTFSVFLQLWFCLILSAQSRFPYLHTRIHFATFNLLGQPTALPL